MSNGFYAQQRDTSEANGAGWTYSGIRCFLDARPNAATGDLVNLTGTYVEHFDESEIDLTGGGFTVIGTAPAPDPVSVLITDVNDGGSGTPPPGGWPNGEEWEGVLVRVQFDMSAIDTLESGCSSSSPTRWGVFQANAPSESLFVQASGATHAIPPPGGAVTFLQGVMSYDACHRKIVPRSDEDVGYIGAPSILWAFSRPTDLALAVTDRVDVVFSRAVSRASSEDLGNYSFLSGLSIVVAVLDAADPTLVHLTTDPQSDGLEEELFVENVASEGGALMPGPQSFRFHGGLTRIHDIQFVTDPASDDASPLRSHVVSTVGVATTSTFNTGTTAFSIGVEPAVARGGSGWNGLRVAVPGAGAEIGDLIRASGTVAEILGRTTIAFSGFGAYETIGTDTPPAPISLSSPDLVPYAVTGVSEPLEDVLVLVEEAVIDSTDRSELGEWWMLEPGFAGTPDSTNARLDHLASGVDADLAWEPCAGNTIALTGVVACSAGECRVIPRRTDDVSNLAFGSGCVVSTGEIFSPRLSPHTRSYPNPFNPSTTIEFTTHVGGAVKLEIYDPSGRRVRALLTGAGYESGTHGVRWDGRDDAGRPAASGTYFYRVELVRESLQGALTLVR